MRAFFVTEILRIRQINEGKRDHRDSGLEVVPEIGGLWLEFIAWPPIRGQQLMHLAMLERRPPAAVLHESSSVVDP
jgi:hypothetical protein